MFAVLNSATGSFAMVEKPPEPENLQADKQALEAVEAEIAAAERQMKVAQKRMEKAAQRLDKAARQRLVENYLNVSLEADQPYQLLRQVRTVVNTCQAGEVGNTLVIPTAQTKPQQIVTIMEDMNVMVRIWDKKLSEARMISGVGIGGYGGGYGGYGYGGYGGYGYGGHGGGQTQGILVDGYGALFLTKVNFSLSPPAQKQQEQTEEPADRVWEETRRELYELGGDKTVFRHHERRIRSSQEYDPEKVEELKRILINTFKHTANIRNLEPDEWVVVTVAGEGGLPEEVADCAGCHQAGDRETEPGQNSCPAATVMTVRVKKSDVDAFAGAELDSDEFRQTVQVLMY
jgi:hypothetical protein